MTREEIIALAREAGFFGLEDRKTIGPWERFAALIAAHEREDIAKMFDASPKLIEFATNEHGGCVMCGFTPAIAASTIRARKNQ